MSNPNGHRAGNKSSQKALDAHEKARKALELREKGFDFQEIADQLGYRSTSSAYAAFKKGLRATIEVPSRQMRELHLRRLERLLRNVMPYTETREVEKRESYVGGDGKNHYRKVKMIEPPSLEAVDRARHLLKNIAELRGLDAPKRHRHGGDPDAPPVSHQVLTGHLVLTPEQLRLLPTPVLESLLALAQPQAQLPYGLVELPSTPKEITAHVVPEGPGPGGPGEGPEGSPPGNPPD
jgi:AraC-like DNA-binding protein